jgi:hypothetical protein
MKTYTLFSQVPLRRVELASGQLLGYTNGFVSALVDLTSGRGKTTLKQGFSIPNSTSLDLVLLDESWGRNVLYRDIPVARLSQSDEQVHNWSSAGSLTINRVNPLALDTSLCAESLSTVFSRMPYIVHQPRFKSTEVFKLEITNALNGIEDVVL